MAHIVSVECVDKLLALVGTLLLKKLVSWTSLYGPFVLKIFVWRWSAFSPRELFWIFIPLGRSLIKRWCILGFFRKDFDVFLSWLNLRSLRQKTAYGLYWLCHLIEVALVSQVNIFRRVHFDDLPCWQQQSYLCFSRTSCAFPFCRRLPDRSCFCKWTNGQYDPFWHRLLLKRLQYGRCQQSPSRSQLQFLLLHLNHGGRSSFSTRTSSRLFGILPFSRIVSKDWTSCFFFSFSFAFLRWVRLNECCDSTPWLNLLLKTWTNADVTALEECEQSDREIGRYSSHIPSEMIPAPLWTQSSAVPSCRMRRHCRPCTSFLWNVSPSLSWYAGDWNIKRPCWNVYGPVTMCVCVRVHVWLSACQHECRYVSLLRVVVCLLCRSRVVVGCFVQNENIVISPAQKSPRGNNCNPQIN